MTKVSRMRRRSKKQGERTCASAVCSSATVQSDGRYRAQKGGNECENPPPRRAAAVDHGCARPSSLEPDGELLGAA